MLNKKLFFRILINSAFGLILIGVWSRFIDLKELIVILKGVDFKYGAIFFLLFFLSGLLRGLRLKFLLKSYHLPFKDVAMLSFLSQFLSFMIPVRAGEITKSVYLNSQFDLPLSKTMVWIFLDRFLDFWTVLFLISIFLIIVPNNFSPDLVKSLFLLFATLSIFLILTISSQNLARKILHFISQLLIVGRLKQFFLTFGQTILEGLDVLQRHPAEIIILLLISVAVITLESLIWLVTFLSLGVNLGVGKSILGNSLTALTFLIPSAPGYVGSAEAAGLAVFSGILGLEANLASAATVVFHILTLITLPILGIASLYFLKFDLGLVWKKIKK